MELPTLYQRDSKDRVRMWSVACGEAGFAVEYGLVDGKKTFQTTDCIAKNVGKANETTVAEQALLEAKAKHRQQVEREDYHEDVDQAGLQFRPMLAQDYLKVPHLVDWDRVTAQPKLDGLRLTYGRRGPDADVDEFLSRKGDNYTLPHLEEACIELYALINQLINDSDGWCQMLDGEVYYHGWTLQKINSAARRQQADTAQLEYYLFDLCIEDMVFEDRHNLLEYALSQVAPNYPQLKLVLCQPCDSEAQAEQIQGACIRRGFEGVMLRHIDSEYGVATRSSDLFKYKSFFDVECKITGIKVDKNKCAVLLCTHPETQQEFGCTPKRTHEERKAMVGDRSLLGQYITVKYQGLSPEGVPLFPVGLGLRECTDAGEPVS